LSAPSPPSVQSLPLIQSTNCQDIGWEAKSACKEIRVKSNASLNRCSEDILSFHRNVGDGRLGASAEEKLSNASGVANDDCKYQFGVV